MLQHPPLPPASQAEVDSYYDLPFRREWHPDHDAAGGVPALKALASVFRTMRFMPTGGVSPGNLAEFLAIPAVLACGGSWLTPKAAIEAGDYGAVTCLAAEAVEIATAGKN